MKAAPRAQQHAVLTTTKGKELAVANGGESTCSAAEFIRAVGDQTQRFASLHAQY